MANDLDLALPESVTVAFPYLAAGGEDSPCAFYAVTLASLNLPDLYGVSGFPGSKLFRSSAVAGYGSGGTPANDAELRALAVQVATDYYLHMLAPCDLSFAGVVGWEPEGLTDWLEVTQAGGRITTRVRRGPWLDHAGELLHFGSHGSADDALPSPVKVIDATPTADGYYQAVLVYWDPAGAAWRNVPTEAPVPAFGDPAFSLGVPVYLRLAPNNPLGSPLTTTAPPQAANTVYPGALPQEIHPGDGIPVYVAGVTSPPLFVQRGGGSVSVPEGYYPGVLYSYNPSVTGAAVWILFDGLPAGHVLDDADGLGGLVAPGDTYPAAYQGDRAADGLPVVVVQVSGPNHSGILLGHTSQHLGHGIKTVDCLAVTDRSGSLATTYLEMHVLGLYCLGVTMEVSGTGPGDLGFRDFYAGAITADRGFFGALDAAQLTGILSGGTF